jgi:serine/threonine-protein kinase
MKSEPVRPVMRFSLPLPDGQLFTNTGRKVLTLSPDGRNLVFVANQQLHLRALSDLESHPIPGSEVAAGLLSPTFSPDGQAVAYYSNAENSIKRLAITGGAAVTVCAATGPYGMSWGPDGIVFGQRGKGIVRVSANSGTPEVIVPLEDTLLGSSPHILPGGRAVLFSVKKAADLWDKGQVVVQVLKGGARKTLVDGAAEGRYLPTGHLVFARSGVLLAVPFDLAGLAVTGGPVPVIEGVQRTLSTPNSTGVAHFDFSSTGSLIYWPGPATTSSSGTDLALFDRKGGVQPLKLPRRLYRSPRVSPDGKYVVLDSEDDKDSIVWVYELSGRSAIRQLTFGGKNRAPIWSHDAQWILFQSDREGDLAIFRQRADGSGAAERLTKPDAGAAHWPQSMTPDGAHLLFSVTKDPAPPSLWTMTMKDRRTEALSGVQAREAVFSPDGRWLAYQTSGTGVFVEPFPRTGAQYLVPQGGGHPFWSPAGDEIILNTSPRTNAAIAVTTKPSVAFGRPVDFSRIGRTEGNPAIERRNVDMLPDGQHVVGVMLDTDVGTRAPQITVVLNWFDDVRQRVPTR